MNLRLWSIRLACLLGSFALCGVALEIGLRLFAPVPPSWLAIYDEHPRLPYSLLPSTERRVDTGVTEWTVRTDDERFRIGPAGAISADEPHWLVLGDSFAFGHGVDAELGLVGRLQVETGKRIANAAVPGFGPAQYRASLAEHIDRPGLEGVIVVPYLGNDFHDALWDKTATIHDGVLGLRPGLKGRIKRNSHLYRFVSRALHRLGVSSRDGTLDLEAELMDSAGWADRLAGAEPIWSAAYGEMREECSARGLPIVVLLIPNRSAVDEGVREGAFERAEVDRDSLDPSLATTTATEWITATGLECLDATGALVSMSGERYLPFDGHLTAQANAEVARALAGPVSDALDETE